MQSKPYTKGKRAELELVYKLWRAGYAVVRAPASGAKAKWVFYPDVVAVKYDGTRYRVLVLEVKLRRRKQTIHLSKRRIALLREFARRAGAEVYIAVKVESENRWYIFPLDLLKEQEDRYVISVYAYFKALPLEHLF